MVTGCPSARGGMVPQISVHGDPICGGKKREPTLDPRGAGIIGRATRTVILVAEPTQNRYNRHHSKPIFPAADLIQAI